MRLRTISALGSFVILLGCGGPIQITGVPYVSQAPYANWEDPIFREGCEEAAIIMAMGWIEGKEAISDKEAVALIRDLNAYEKEHYGYYLDSSAEDTMKLIEDYFDYNKVELHTDITNEDIIAELRADNVVIVPINSRILTNPHFTPPGPLNHMIVIFGYDSRTNEFITHEPGTEHGDSYRYDADIVNEALQDYPSGFEERREEIQKNMIVVRRPFFR